MAVARSSVSPGRVVYTRPPGQAPSWVGSTPVNGWIAIPGTSFTGSGIPSVNPYAQAVEALVDYWNSLCVDLPNQRAYLLAPGGHTDSAYNGVVELFYGEGPGLIERVVSSAAGAISAPGSGTNLPTYTDGRPRSAHTYATPHWVSKANRGFLFGQGSVWNGGANTSSMFAYVKDASDWENATGDYELWGLLSGTQTESVRCVCKHHVTEDIYYTAQPSGTSTLYRWSITGTTPGSASHTDLGATGGGVPFNAAFYCSAIDHTRNRIVFWRGDGGGGPSTTVHIYDITAATWSEATLTGAAAATITNGGNYQGFQYNAITDLFYTRLRGGSGGTVYTIHPSSFAVAAPSTTGGAGIPADVNGPNNRFIMVPEISPGSSVGGILYLVNYDAGAYFLRLH